MSRFTITLSGLAEADAARFRAALEDQPTSSWRLVDGQTAYVMVVDIDTVWGHMDWLRATASDQRVVVYTERNEVREGEWLLTKPLRPEALHGLLDEVAAADTHGAGVAALVASPVPAPVAAKAEPPVAVELPPEPATLGELLLAGRIDRPLRIEGGDGVVLQLDPERGGYYGPLTLKSLQPLLSLPMDAAQPPDDATLARARLAPALPLTRLLWFAALCATPGRLSASLDPLVPYRLTRWPQIEREFPRHFRIATTMMKQPGTLEEVAAAANAPAGDVADFINAYCMAGYVAADAPATESATDNASGMFSRLRRPFARGGQEPA